MIRVESGVGQLRVFPLAVLGKGTPSVEHIIEVPIVGVDLFKNREHTAEVRLTPQSTRQHRSESDTFCAVLRHGAERHRKQHTEKEKTTEYYISDEVIT